MSYWFEHVRIVNSFIGDKVTRFLVLENTNTNYEDEEISQKMKKLAQIFEKIVTKDMALGSLWG